MIRHGVSRSMVASKRVGGGLPTPSFVLRICPPASFSVSKQQPQRQEFHVSRSVCNNGDDSSRGVDVDFYRTQLKERKTAFTDQQLINDKKPPPRGTMTRTRRGFENGSARPRGSASSYRTSRQHHRSHRTPSQGNKRRMFPPIDATQKHYAMTQREGSLYRRSSVATAPSSREHATSHETSTRGNNSRMFRAVDKIQKDHERTHRKGSSYRSNDVKTPSNRQCATFQTTPTRGNKARTRRVLEQTQKDSPLARKSKSCSSARSVTKLSHDESAPLSSNKEPSPSSWPSTTLKLFISCLPGLEPILAAELTALGGFAHKTPNIRHGGGGGILTEATSLTKLMECHLWLGTASHILLRCGEPFSARGWPELHRKLVRMPWQLVLQPNVELDVRVTSSKSKLYHTEAVAERVSKAIYESLGRPDDGGGDATTETTDEDEEQPQINKHSNENTVHLLVRVHRDMFQISIDTSLTPLHQRGYRFETAKAPLREDLAFALLHAVGWTPRSHRMQIDTTPNPYNALLDPFCGSGTIAIEGAAMLAGLPPGRLRPPPLAGTQLYDPTGWNQLKEDSCSPLITDAPPTVLVAASDRDAGAVDAARSNAQRAGVFEQIDFSVSALASHPWWDHPRDEETSLLVATNPPHGKRISSSKKRDGLLPLYQALGQRILAQQGAATAILVKNVNLARKTGLPVKAAFTARHGGIPVSAMVTNNYV